MRKLLFAIAVFASGCGPDNIKTCNEFMKAVSCGGDPTNNGLAHCDEYQLEHCDLKPFFDCLKPYYSCMNGEFDKAMIKTGQDLCAAKATCK